MSAEGSGVSTEVSTQTPPAPAAVMIPEGASENITTFLADLQVAYQIAVRLVATSFVPQSYSGKPQEAAAAILTGQGVGLGPMESLRSIDIIQGTPAMRAVALRALVVSHGHEIWVEESSPNRAVVAGRRKGSDVVQRSVWDVDRARGLNLLNKDNWKKQQGAMLIARATSECARLVAPDALLGIPYSSEELLDDVTVLDAESSPKPSAPRTARRKPSPVPEPQVDPEPTSEPSTASVSAPSEPSEVVLFACARCGEQVVETDGNICEPCEVEIEREIEGAGS